MIAEKMKPYVKNNSAIRMMFEEGNRLRAIYGADKVYDFSLGNPSVPAPECVKEAIIDLVNEVEPTVLHGYMSNAGFEDVRQTIAESLNHRFGTKFAAKNLIMTVGAASGLNVIFKTILNPEEEVIVFAPYFLEYGAYVRNFDGRLVEISPDTTTFQPNLEEFEQKITADCKRGNRPSFIRAGAPDMAENLYKYIIARCKEHIDIVEQGEFGADMKVELVNDGPFTVILDSNEL